MSVLIIACGDTGVTHKVAAKLSQLIKEKTDIVLGKNTKDVGGYDKYIVGTNIHFGKFNKAFYKTVKKVSLTNATDVYVYISGAEVEKKEHYISVMKDIIPQAKEVRFVWGELLSDGLKFFKKFAVESFIKGRKDDGLPTPRILDKEVKALARAINGEK